MTRITKAAAAIAAAAITKKLFDTAAAAKKEIKTWATKKVISTLPEMVKNCFSEYGCYFDKSTSFYLSGEGITYDTREIWTLTALPRKNNSGQMLLNKTDAAEIYKLRNDYEEKNKAAKKAKTEIETALFNLRTYKRVLELYPEAYSFLPTPKEAENKTCMALIPCLDKLRALTTELNEKIN